MGAALLLPGLQDGCKPKAGGIKSGRALCMGQPDAPKEQVDRLAEDERHSAFCMFHPQPNHLHQPSCKISGAEAQQSSKENCQAQLLPVPQDCRCSVLAWIF